MRCPVDMPRTIPPESRHDLWVRYLAGHRRVASEFVGQVANYCSESFDEPAGWLVKLLGGRPVPVFGCRYGIIDGGGTIPGTKCWRLTDAGVRAVDEWLEDGDFYEPICGQRGPSRLALLVIWGAGCGIPGHHWASQLSSRQDALAEILPGGRRVARWFVTRRQSSIQTRDVLNKLAWLQDRPDIDLRRDLHVPVRAITARRSGSIVRWLHESAAFGTPWLIEPTRRAKDREGLGRFGLIDADAWSLVRKICRKRRVVGLPERSRVFGHNEASRCASRQSRPPDLPLSAGVRSQLSAIKETQRIMRRIMSSHPGAIAMTGTLWAIPGFKVYRSDHVRAGQPTALDVVSDQGDAHPLIRTTTRVVDGVCWVPGDQEEKPSVWIEYEADRTNLRTWHHIAAALAMSSRWGKEVTLVIAVARPARAEVLRVVREFAADRMAEKRGADWPGAKVRVRVIPTWGEGVCPLHGATLLERCLVAHGRSLRDVATDRSRPITRLGNYETSNTPSPRYSSPRSRS
ncbi:MAG: hypothetical protein O3A89_10440 [Actinomycetota bacterium]|nr:hypothetical protein [Actinomycetota bacterium]